MANHSHNHYSGDISMVLTIAQKDRVIEIVAAMAVCEKEMSDIQNQTQADLQSKRALYNTLRAELMTMK